MFTVILGANENKYTPDEHHIISNAFSMNNCFTLFVKVLEKAFGIEKYPMTTIPAVTNDQRMLDMHHRNLHRALVVARRHIELGKTWTLIK